MILCNEISGKLVLSPHACHTHISKDLQDVGRVCTNDRQSMIPLISTHLPFFANWNHPVSWYVMMSTLIETPSMSCGRPKWSASTRPLLPGPRFVASNICLAPVLKTIHDAVQDRGGLVLQHIRCPRPCHREERRL